jgi:hypothetical protein
MDWVYLVYTENAGLLGVYATVDAARNIVEHNSIVHYGCRSDSEIWTTEYGNADVWYVKTKVLY